jgi:hypothetical protein
MLHNATQRNATQRNATQRNATQRNATQRNATQRNATQRNANSPEFFQPFSSLKSFFLFYGLSPFTPKSNPDLFYCSFAVPPRSASTVVGLCCNRIINLLKYNYLQKYKLIS